MHVAAVLQNRKLLPSFLLECNQSLDYSAFGFDPEAFFV